MNKFIWVLTDRQLCDCEMILNKSFAPLDRFMTKKDYESVLKNMRLSSGELFPLPIMLDVNKEFADQIKVGDKILLIEKEGFQVAKILVEDIWEPDLNRESKLVYRTSDLVHPAVNYLMNESNKIYVGGRLELISLPNHYDYKKYRMDPLTVKSKFNDFGWDKIAAFQTRNPMHRAHVEMTLSAMKNYDVNLLIHPVVGLTKPGDLDHFTRVRCYEAIIKKYPSRKAMLALLPLAMRMGGPREGLLHAIIRKNYGCTHIIIGRDHAGPGIDSNGDPFYHEYEAQNLIKKHESEVGIKMIPFQLMVYLPKENLYRPLEMLQKNTKYENISGTRLRKMIDNDENIPKWFSYPEVVSEMKKMKQKTSKRGFTVFFTGLSGSGKSTLANGLLSRLLEEGSRAITLLDGDIVRTHLSSELGFSKKHRSINVQRIGFVASEITKNGGVAICAPIAPYANDRGINRKLISKYGGFFEVFVDTPLAICESRDSKGLYKLAREGKIKNFTGVSDPYEKPVNPDLIINSDGTRNPSVLVDSIFTHLVKMGFIKEVK